MIIIKFPEFIGAALCAAKNDSILRGIYVDRDGHIVGTNKQIMFVGRCENNTNTDRIIVMRGEYPTTFNNVCIDVIQLTASFYNNESALIFTGNIDIIHETYPDWKHVTKIRQLPTNEICIDLKNMCIFNEISDNYDINNRCKLKLQGDVMGIRVEFTENTFGIISQTRLD